MSYNTRIKKFGNSLMFVLPNKVAEFLNLEIDDPVELKLKDGQIILTKKEINK